MMKTAQLEIRPVFHRLEDRVRAHAFLCMLACYVLWHMRKAMEPLLADPKMSLRLLLEKLGALQRNTVEMEGRRFEMCTQAAAEQQAIFKALGVRIPV